MALPDQLLLGTSSFSSKDWYGVFYPENLPEKEMLRHYATCGTGPWRWTPRSMARPARKTVLNWKERTPSGFELAVKMPQLITHEKCLVDCDDELLQFVNTMDLLGERLVRSCLQFQYFKKSDIAPKDFLDRLTAFLPKLAARPPVRGRGAQQAAGDRALSRPAAQASGGVHADRPPVVRAAGRLMARHDILTANFSYVRWLGDRYQIEEVTKNWDKVVVDREREMDEWAKVIAQLLARNVRVYAFANNHFSGHAPASLALFTKAFREPPRGKDRREHPLLGRESSLPRSSGNTAVAVALLPPRQVRAVPGRIRLPDLRRPAVAPFFRTGGEVRCRCVSVTFCLLYCIVNRRKPGGARRAARRARGRPIPDEDVHARELRRFEAVEVPGRGAHAGQRVARARDAAARQPGDVGGSCSAWALASVLSYHAARQGVIPSRRGCPRDSCTSTSRAKRRAVPLRRGRAGHAVLPARHVVRTLRGHADR